MLRAGLNEAPQLRGEPRSLGTAYARVPEPAAIADQTAHHRGFAGAAVAHDALQGNQGIYRKIGMQLRSIRMIDRKAEGHLY